MVTTVFDDKGNLTDAGKSVISNAVREALDRRDDHLWQAVDGIRTELKALATAPTRPCGEHAKLMMTLATIQTAQVDAATAASLRTTNIPKWVSAVGTVAALLISACALALTVHSLLGK